MKILEVSRYKDNFADHQLPFVTEQGESLKLLGEKAKKREGEKDTIEVEYFLVKGNYLTAVKALKTKIREYKPDVVHAHYGLSGVTASLACTPLPFGGEAGREAPSLVTTFHNGEWHSWWVNLISSLMALRAKHLIYVAPHVREKMYFKHPHYSILPCGVPMEQMVLTPYTEARKQLGWSDNKKYILFGGAFDNLRKNYPLLKAAIETMQQNGKMAQWPIEVVEMKGLSREECTLRMCACDLFVLPTKNEGSPQALKEAMTCDCPIIATDCANMRHILGDLKGHYVISSKGKNQAEWVGDDSSINELKVMLEDALSLPVGFRTQGRERIVELGFTNELVAQQLVSIYKSVLQ